MKEALERLFREITHEEEDGVTVSLMQDFVATAFRSSDLDALFEAVDRLNMVGLDEEEIDQSTFLGVIIDFAIEFNRIDVARRAASLLNGLDDPAFGYIKIAEHTKDEEDIRLARRAAYALDEHDQARKAHAFAQLFAVSRYPQDRQVVDCLCDRLLREGYPSLAFDVFVNIVAQTREEADHLRCIGLLEQAERMRVCNNRMVREFLESSTIPRERLDQLFANIRLPRLYTRIIRIQQAHN